MAAAAGASTIGSCFSTATTTTTTTTSTKTSCISITNSKKSDFLLRIACKKLTLQGLSSSMIMGISHKWRRRENFQIFATVEQEEVSSSSSSAVVVEAENIDEVVNQKEEEEVISSEGVVGEDQSTTTNATKVYFGNLPYNCDSAHLAGIVQEYGSPEMVEVLYDKATGTSRGFAFVTMSSVEDAEAVIKSLDGSEYGGRILRVNFADKPKPKEPLYPESEFKLFVGNLSWNVTSESLIEAFQEYGNVVGARVLYDGETGRSRGYGFVCYSTKEEMDVALESLDGVPLDGRPMRVSLAQGRKN